MFDFFKRSARVTVSAVNIKWRGASHSLGKIEVKGRTFDVSIPFQNKAQEDYSLFKTQKKPPVVIRNIDIKPPFKLVSVSPKLPAEVNENEKITIIAKVEAPDYNYEGPLSVDLISDAADMAHIEIPKIILNTPDNHTEIKDKPIIRDVAKGQVIRQNLHLYGTVNPGRVIKKIEVAPPFSFVSSDPKLPFKVDPKTGYLIDLYIQAPQENYGGPLEITMS